MEELFATAEKVIAESGQTKSCLVPQVTYNSQDGHIESFKLNDTTPYIADGSYSYNIVNFVKK